MINFILRIMLTGFFFVMPAFGTLTIQTPSGLVHSTTAIIEGTAVFPSSKPIWFEVWKGESKTRLLDFGAIQWKSPWKIQVRHLEEGVNVVTINVVDPVYGPSSATLNLTLELGEQPLVRPRPRPAEIWWGGLGQVQKLTEPGAAWDFVKKYLDCYFLHTVQSYQPAINQVLAPYLTRFAVELGGGTGVDPGWPYWQSGVGWGAVLTNLQNQGFIFSEATHDFQHNLKDFCLAYPDKSEEEILSIHINAWKIVFQEYLKNNPHLKFSITSSPVWWPWNNFPGLEDTPNFNSMAFNPLLDSNNQPVLVNGQPVSFSFNMADILANFSQMTTQIGLDFFSFTTDCPYYCYFWKHDWAPPSNQISPRMRTKVRDYESWIHSVGMTHNFIANEDPGAEQGTNNPNAWHQQYMNNSFLSMVRHQQWGGRADRYLFESWYSSTTGTHLPSIMVPETDPLAFTNLALRGIKFLKGIRDLNGTPETLRFDLLRDGTDALVRLTNTGDVACLPALVAFESGDTRIPITYQDSGQIDITAQILTAEGYVHTPLLEPGQSLDISIKSNPFAAISSPGYRSVSLEAFWNPQDPTGIVRDRLKVIIHNPENSLLKIH